MFILNALAKVYKVTITAVGVVTLFAAFVVFPIGSVWLIVGSLLCWITDAQTVSYVAV